MSKLSKRFSEALTAGRVTQNGPALAPKQYILAAVFDLDATAAANAVSSIQKSIPNGTVLILVTDLRDIALFQLTNCITEFVPNLDQLKARFPGKSASTYVSNRMALLLQKWQPVQTIAIGPRANDLFAKI